MKICWIRGNFRDRMLSKYLNSQLWITIVLLISMNLWLLLLKNNQVSKDSVFYSVCFAANVKHRVWHLLMDAHMVIPVDSKYLHSINPKLKYFFLWIGTPQLFLSSVSLTVRYIAPNLQALNLSAGKNLFRTSYKLICT